MSNLSSRTGKIYIEESEETTIVKTKRKRKVLMEMDLEFTQLYKIVNKFLLRVNSIWSVRYGFYLATEVMNKDTDVDVGSRNINKFLDFVKEELGEAPTELTIRRAIKELSDVGFLIKLNRGNYRLNPAIFWKTNVNGRVMEVQNLVHGGFEDKLLIDKQ